MIKKPPRRIAVLGSGGQIGRPLKKFLKSKGFQPIAIDITDCPKHDLRKPVFRDHLLNDPYYTISTVDYIVFLAFDVGGSKYLRDYQNTYQFIDNNIQIMNNVFSLISMYEIPFLFASSAMANMPWSTYGLLKALGERYSTALGGLSSRFWNVYGPEPLGEKSHAITDFVGAAKANGIINMQTDGKEKRDFMHVDDCSEAIYQIITNHDEIKEMHGSCTPLDIATGNWTSILNVAQIVAEHFNARVVPKSGVGDVVQNDAMPQPNISLISKWFSPTISIETGIKKVIQDSER